MKTHIFPDFSYMCTNNLLNCLWLFGVGFLTLSTEKFLNGIVTDSKTVLKNNADTSDYPLRLSKSWILYHHTFFFFFYGITFVMGDFQTQTLEFKNSFLSQSLALALEDLVFKTTVFKMSFTYLEIIDTRI